MDCIFRGQIHITDDINLITSILQAPFNDRLRIIDLEEQCKFKNHPMVLNGEALMPPIVCQQAEVNGDEQGYTQGYIEFLQQPFQYEFLTAMLGYMYRKGGSFLIYVSDIRTILAVKIREVFTYLFGIEIGIYGTVNCVFDLGRTYQWLSILYTGNFISDYEFLRDYPLNCEIDPFIMQSLIANLHIYGDNYQDQINTVYQLCNRLKENPYLVNPIY